MKLWWVFSSVVKMLEFCCGTRPTFRHETSQRGDHALHPEIQITASCGRGLYTDTQVIHTRQETFTGIQSDEHPVCRTLCPR